MGARTQIFEVTEKGTKVTSKTDYELPYSIIGKIIDKLKGEKEMSTYMHVLYKNAKRILEEK